LKQILFVFFTIKRNIALQMSIFVQYSKKTNKPKKDILRSMPDRGVRRTSNRFQTAEPKGEAEPTGETKTAVLAQQRRLGYLDHYDALKNCLYSIGDIFQAGGMLHNDKNINDAIKEVEMDLLLETAYAEEDWIKAWAEEIDDQEGRTKPYPPMPDTDYWKAVEDTTNIMVGIWETVDRDTDKKLIKRIRKDFVNAQAANKDAEEGAYYSNEYWEGKEPWWEARNNRNRANKKWLGLVGMSAWKGKTWRDFGSNKEKNEWKPVTLTVQNLAANFEQIQIRTWARLVIAKLLVGKKIRITYKVEQEGQVDNVLKEYTATVHTGESLDKRYNNGEYDRRLYAVISADQWEPGLDWDKWVKDEDAQLPLHLLRIEKDDPIDTDTINSFWTRKQIKLEGKLAENPKYYSDEDEPIVDGGEEIGDLIKAFRQRDLAFKKGDLVYTKDETPDLPVFYVGKITDVQLNEGEIDSADNEHKYKITCGKVQKFHIPIKWKEGDTKWVLGGSLHRYERDVSRKTGEMFMNDKKITRVYLELTGPYAGKQMAILQKKNVRGHNKEPEETMSFVEMTTAEEQADINTVLKEEEEEEKNEEEAVGVLWQDEAPNFDTIYQYKPGQLTYQVRFNPERQQQPYRNFEIFENFVANRQKEAKAELLSAAIKSWYSETNEVDDDGEVDDDEVDDDDESDDESDDINLPPKIRRINFDNLPDSSGEERDSDSENDAVTVPNSLAPSRATSPVQSRATTPAPKSTPAESQEDYIKRYIKENTIEETRSEEDIQDELQNEFDAQTEFVDLVADDGTEFKGVPFVHILPDEVTQPINGPDEDSDYKTSPDDDDDDDDDDE
jgi:hypothetical protein